MAIVATVTLLVPMTAASQLGRRGRLAGDSV